MLDIDNRQGCLLPDLFERDQLSVIVRLISTKMLFGGYRDV